MTLEEFFKKKKIDLPALEKANAVLFSEFKNHFGQMGEKSFEHSKKYWFNKLRHQFPVQAEVKTEKVVTANPIAQQTSIESLTHEVAKASAPTAPKLGFAPKFRAAGTPKPAADADQNNDADVAAKPVGNTSDLPAENIAPKAAYVPKFKMKPKVETEVNQPEIEQEAPAVENIFPEQAPVNPVPKVAYVPKFKMKPKVEAEQNLPEIESPPTVPESNISELPTEIPAPKVPYVPKFKMKPRVEAAQNPPEAEPAPVVPENSIPEQSSAENKPENELTKPAIENTEAKPVYKPRFNMKNNPPKNEG